jgi:hypothetical protein
MTNPAPLPTSLPSTPVRWRAILLGLVIAVGLNIFDPISNYLIASSTFGNSHIPFTVLFGILFTAYVWNPVARTWLPGAVFERRDLAGVLAVGFIGGTIPSFGARFVGVISAPAYFATPENEWPAYVLPNLQRWLFPSNAGGGVDRFYRGIQSGESIPWDIWITPMAWWLSFVGCVVLACVCLMVILRKQWSENERLAYPLVVVPLRLVEEPPPGRLFPAFTRDRIFWIGFGISAGMLLWNTLGHFYLIPRFGFINSYAAIDLGRGFYTLMPRFDFYVICFAFFTPLEILFSVWAFHLLAVFQAGISNRIGFGPASQDAGVSQQNAWGLTVFVLWGLWMARHHLLDVWRKAWGRASHIDDSGELLSYRAATFGFLFAIAYIFFWLCRTNMGPAIALGYMFFTLVLYLGMAKIVAQSGLISLRGNAPGILGLVGTPNLSDTSIAALHQVGGAMFAYVKGFAMTGSANAARAAEAAGEDKRRLGRTLLMAGMCGIIGYVGITLFLGYAGMGAENFGDYEYTVGNRFGFNYTVSEIKGRADVERDWWGVAFSAFGAVTTTLLIALNQRYPWWPLHPVGFTISIQWPTRASAFSVFLAWLLKTILLRIGGNQLYNRSCIFIYGLLLGYASVVTLSFILDIVFFMGRGHSLHAPPI